MLADPFLKLIDALPDAVLLVSPDGVVLGASRRVVRLGLEPDALRGRPLADVTLEPGESVTAYLRRCVRTSEPLPGSLTLRRSDGHALPCRSDGNRLSLTAGTPGPIVVLRLLPKDSSIHQFLVLNQQNDALLKSVRRRKRAEEELREQKEWLRVALRSIGDAVIATDTHGRVAFMNPVAESLCGWPEAEAVGRPLEDVFQIVNETTRSPAECPVGKVLREGSVVGLANHTVLVSRDHTEMPIDDSAAPIVDEAGSVSGVILVFRDVSGKRKAAEAQQRLAAIVESSDDIIASKTLGGIITSWNRGAERILGYKAEEIIGRHVSTLMPPESIEDTTLILGRIARGERVEHYQTRRRRKDGTIIDVSLTVSPVRDEDGRIIGASKIGRDITELKQIEAERREADRRKDEFLAMLAHELRNPLASINNAVHLFGQLETENDLEWAKEVVQRQVKHLARLIDDLLDVSRISRGKIGLRKEAIDLSPVVSSAVEAVRPLLEERKHELSVSLVNGGLRLEADPLRLEQMLVNLLNNAAKYTEGGGKISLTARREGPSVVISVKDTGIGIPPELLPRVFDLFAQGDRAIARSEGGLGIGLTLVQKLATMHGGEVTATSEGPGKGSEFIVRIPGLELSSAPRTGANETLPRAPRERSRVLVVDDNTDSAAGLARLLRLLGHDVRVAYHGEAAVEIARTHWPEVVLLDIGLPGMDGYQVVRQLRSEECGKHALIVAVSGYGQPEDLLRSREAGFDEHLVKPVDYDILMNVLGSPRA